MGTDKRGVDRGPCQVRGCSCSEYEVERKGSLRCDYCAHTPVDHLPVSETTTTMPVSVGTIPMGHTAPTYAPKTITMDKDEESPPPSPSSWHTALGQLDLPMTPQEQELDEGSSTITLSTQFGEGCDRMHSLIQDGDTSDSKDSPIQAETEPDLTEEKPPDGQPDVTESHSSQPCVDDVGSSEGAEQVYEQDSGYYAQEAGIQAENNEIFFSGWHTAGGEGIRDTSLIRTTAHDDRSSHETDQVPDKEFSDRTTRLEAPPDAPEFLLQDVSLPHHFEIQAQSLNHKWEHQHDSQAKQLELTSSESTQPTSRSQEEWHNTSNNEKSTLTGTMSNNQPAETPLTESDNEKGDTYELFDKQSVKGEETSGETGSEQTTSEIGATENSDQISIQPPSGEDENMACDPYQHLDPETGDGTTHATISAEGIEITQLQREEIKESTNSKVKVYDYVVSGTIPTPDGSEQDIFEKQESDYDHPNDTSTKADNITSKLAPLQLNLSSDNNKQGMSYFPDAMKDVTQNDTENGSTVKVPSSTNEEPSTPDVNIFSNPTPSEQVPKFEDAKNYKKNSGQSEHRDTNERRETCADIDPNQSTSGAPTGNYGTDRIPSSENEKTLTKDENMVKDTSAQPSPINQDNDNTTKSKSAKRRNKTRRGKGRGRGKLYYTETEATNPKDSVAPSDGNKQATAGNNTLKHRKPSEKQTVEKKATSATSEGIILDPPSMQHISPSDDNNQDRSRSQFDDDDDDDDFKQVMTQGDASENGSITDMPSSTETLTRADNMVSNKPSLDPKTEKDDQSTSTSTPLEHDHTASIQTLNSEEISADTDIKQDMSEIGTSERDETIGIQPSTIQKSFTTDDKKHFDPSELSLAKTEHDNKYPTETVPIVYGDRAQKRTTKTGKRSTKIKSDATDPRTSQRSTYDSSKQQTAEKKLSEDGSTTEVQAIKSEDALTEMVPEPLEGVLESYATERNGTSGTLSSTTEEQPIISGTTPSPQSDSTLTGERQNSTKPDQTDIYDTGEMQTLKSGESAINTNITEPLPNIQSTEGCSNTNITEEPVMTNTMGVSSNINVTDVPSTEDRENTTNSKPTGEYDTIEKKSMKAGEAPLNTNNREVQSNEDIKEVSSNPMDLSSKTNMAELSDNNRKMEPPSDTNISEASLTNSTEVSPNTNMMEPYHDTNVTEESSETNNTEASSITNMTRTSLNADMKETVFDTNTTDVFSNTTMTLPSYNTKKTEPSSNTDIADPCYNTNVTEESSETNNAEASSTTNMTRTSRNAETKETVSNTNSVDVSSNTNMTEPSYNTNKTEPSSNTSIRKESSETNNTEASSTTNIVGASSNAATKETFSDTNTMDLSSKTNMAEPSSNTNKKEPPSNTNIPKAYSNANINTMPPHVSSLDTAKEDTDDSENGSTSKSQSTTNERVLSHTGSMPSEPQDSQSPSTCEDVRQDRAELDTPDNGQTDMDDRTSEPFRVDNSKTTSSNSSTIHQPPRDSQNESINNELDVQNSHQESFNSPAASRDDGWSTYDSDSQNDSGSQQNDVDQLSDRMSQLGIEDRLQEIIPEDHQYMPEEAIEPNTSGYPFNYIQSSSNQSLITWHSSPNIPHHNQGRRYSWNEHAHWRTQGEGFSTQENVSTQTDSQLEMSQASTSVSVADQDITTGPLQDLDRPISSTEVLSPPHHPMRISRGVSPLPHQHPDNMSPIVKYPGKVTNRFECETCHVNLSTYPDVRAHLSSLRHCANIPSTYRVTKRVRNVLKSYPHVLVVRGLQLMCVDCEEEYQMEPGQCMSPHCQMMASVISQCCGMEAGLGSIDENKTKK